MISGLTRSSLLARRIKLKLPSARVHQERRVLLLRVGMFWLWPWESGSAAASSSDIGSDIRR
jgi:hypothetical protein